MKLWVSQEGEIPFYNRVWSPQHFPWRNLKQKGMLLQGENMHVLKFRGKAALMYQQN